MKKDFRKKILSNGMTVLFEKRDVPVVSVAFAVRAGGINESVDEKGISHFIEHMLYKGTSKRNYREIAEEIERKGGELNGFTDETITAFWCKMPSKHLDTALDVLGDIMQNPLFDEKEIEKERKVIFEEQKMRKDNPMIHVLDEAHSCLYEGTLGMPLIGTHKTMNSIDREKLIQKFKEIYEPNNMILCVVGDADFNEITKFAEKNFGNKRGKVPKQKFSLKTESKTLNRKGIDQSHVIFSYHVPTLSNRKSYAAEILNTILAEGMSSRLFEEIREKRNLAYAVKGESDINRDYAYNIVYVGTTRDKVEEVKKIILNEMKDVSENISEKELETIKEQLIGKYDISLEDSVHQMNHLLFFEVNSRAEDFYDFKKNIKSVRLEDVREIARNSLKKHSFLELVPKI